MNGSDMPNQFRVLDLFSGIGGFSLGLERAGMETVAFCEQDGYARRVLRKHWPDVWLYDDVRTLTAKRLKADGLKPNVICGGFPCQDISTAGKGAGIDGARSGLWSEMFRITKEIRPDWVVAENVPALRGRGADRVLADLEGAGYAARPVVVGAWAVGGNHQRERVWVVANRNGLGRGRGSAERGPLSRARLDGPALPEVLADTKKFGTQRGPGVALADSISVGCRDDYPGRSNCDGDCENVAYPSGAGLQARGADGLGAGPPGADAPAQRGWWAAEPAVGRVAHGIPARVDRLRTLGNAVVPLIPELIGRFIVSSFATCDRPVEDRHAEA